jgi:N-glycosylase/DNA lyase
MTVSGVGPKVANCVALFGYHRIEAFPVDVWISRVLAEHYPQGFPFGLYEGFAGVIQQYMFYYARR